MMVGQEADPPYNRPTLSKERLRNEIGDERALFHPAEYYRSKEIELLLEHAIQRVNVAEHSIQLANAGALSYDRALIVTGAHVRRLNAPATDLAGIYYLRSLHDCRALSESFKQRPRVLVAGTGFIGCEVAASARSIGCDVTLVGKTPPLVNALGPEISALYTQYHRAQGVDLRTDTFVERFEGNGRLERAVLLDGSRVECDVAVIGIGVEPSLDILKDEPVELGDGVLVDEFCQTSVPDVFAAGDVASSWYPRYQKRIRVEHFDNAQHQAIVAARAMLGPTDPYDPIPSFWSDQFSYKLRYRGYAPQWESVVFRGDRDAGSFSAFYIAQGVVEAVCSVNRYAENYSSQRLIGKHAELRILQDDAIDVKEIEMH